MAAKPTKRIPPAPIDITEIVTMIATATPAAARPIWHVRHRVNSYAARQVIASGNTKPDASKTMFSLMDDRSGDFWVRESTKPDPNRKRPARRV